MTNIDYLIYERVAKKLLNQIGSSCYFNGSIEVQEDDVTIKLIGTMIISREKIVLPEGVVDTITGIVPVWWECCVVLPEGEDENNFSWREFHPILMKLA